MIFITVADCYSALCNQVLSPLLRLPPELRNTIYEYSFDQASYRPAEFKRQPDTHHYHTNDAQGLSQVCTQLREETLSFLNAFSTVRMLDKCTFTHIMTTNSKFHPLETNCRICSEPHVYDKITTLKISTSALFEFNQVLFEIALQRSERQCRKLASVFPDLDYFTVVDDSDPRDRARMSAYIWADLHMARGIFSPSVDIEVEYRQRDDGIPTFVMRDGPPGFDLPIPLDGYWEGQGIGCS